MRGIIGGGFGVESRLWCRCVNIGNGNCLIRSMAEPSNLFWVFARSLGGNCINTPWPYS